MTCYLSHTNVALADERTLVMYIFLCHLHRLLLETVSQIALLVSDVVAAVANEVGIEGAEEVDQVIHLTDSQSLSTLMLKVRMLHRLNICCSGYDSCGCGYGSSSVVVMTVLATNQHCWPK
jgi:hypothetical protein